MPSAIHRQRVRTALDLTRRGYGPREVAAALGTTPGRAARLVAEGLRSLPVRSPDEERAAALLRVDHAVRTYGALLDDADPATRLAAADGLATAERLRADLLGLVHTAPRSQTA